MRILRTLSVITALASASSVGYGQFHIPGRDKDKDKAEVLKEKEEKRDAKNLRTYEKIQTYSQNKYETDPDFRDEVDQAYSELLRQHASEAYQRNKNRGSHILAIHEDRFREHVDLYDNLLVQSDINRIGQKLVPADSDRVFAFRLLADPTPTAYTLSTGTIYISTGMVSMLDSEAQLVYVLAHEMAHVQLDHWKQLLLTQRGLEAYNADQTKKAEHIAILGGLASALAGGLASKNGTIAVGSGVLGAGAGYIAGSLINRPAVVRWDTAQEDQADQMAMKTMLNARYDVREVPKMYDVLEAVVSRDKRLTLGFLGERSRIRERRDQAQKLIQQSLKPEVDAALKKGFIGDTAGHRNLMAELKRDNGIMAYYYDMFAVAQRNLGEAVSIRDNDPAAQYYYGKVLETIGRTDDERRLAEQCFLKAAQFDKEKENFGSHLHYALALMQDGNGAESTRIRSELDSYVTSYAESQVAMKRKLVSPPDLATISEYMALYGDLKWQPKLPSDAEIQRVEYADFPAKGREPSVPGTNAQAANLGATAATRTKIVKHWCFPECVLWPCRCSVVPAACPKTHRSTLNSSFLTSIKSSDPVV
jgi:predicted Zn-dependent protease